MSTSQILRTAARIAQDARTLASQYEAPEILRLVNVWDAVSARAVSYTHLDVYKRQPLQRV